MITKTGRLQVRSTHDIRNHLRIDIIQSRALQVYRQISVLKENLRASKNLPAMVTVAKVIRA